MKNCPRCSRMLIETNFGAVSVDGCDGCGGVWFDNRELTAVAQAQSAGLKELEETFQPNPFVQERKTQMTCPACKVALVEFEFKHSPGIKLDGCPQCKGIWVDDGELSAIHNRLAGAQAPAASAQPVTPPAPAQTDVRQKARHAMGFLTTVECSGCKQSNPTASLICWACGAILQGKRGFLCPRCDKPLAGEVHASVRIDACSDCRGVWLDAGELPALVRRGPQELKRVEDELKQRKMNMDAVLETRNVLMCPLCYLPLRGQQYAGASGIRLDSCVQCRGVWVDAGELSLVAEFYVHDEDYFKRPSQYQ